MNEISSPSGSVGRPTNQPAGRLMLPSLGVSLNLEWMESVRNTSTLRWQMPAVILKFEQIFFIIRRVNHLFSFLLFRYWFREVVGVCPRVSRFERRLLLLLLFSATWKRRKNETDIYIVWTRLVLPELLPPSSTGLTWNRLQERDR